MITEFLLLFALLALSTKKYKSQFRDDSPRPFVDIVGPFLFFWSDFFFLNSLLPVGSSLQVPMVLKCTYTYTTPVCELGKTHSSPLLRFLCFIGNVVFLEGSFYTISPLSYLYIFFESLRLKFKGYLETEVASELPR